MRIRSQYFMFLLFACVAFSIQSTSFAKEKNDVQTQLLDAFDKTRDRKIPLKVYWTASNKPQPVVLFSHGLGGSREGASYLGNHWASAGYIAVFMQHVGSDKSAWENVPRNQRLEVLKKAANLQNTLHRFADVPFVIDQLGKWNAQKDHSLFEKMNLDKIAMTGHSYGGGTTQSLMGKIYPNGKSVGDSRLDAFIVMSPSSKEKEDSKKAYRKVFKPVLCMTGTKDTSPIRAEVTAEHRRKVFAGLPEKDKYEIVFHDGTHMAFSGRQSKGLKKRNPRYHLAIQKLTTMFLDAYLKDDAKAKAWLQSKAAREVLIEKDVWEWK